MATGVYLDQPSIGPLELDYVSRAVREGEISTRSKYVPLFESALSARLGGARVVATSSGTTALFAACLHAFPPGSTIYLPALTFVATANAAVMAGLKVRVLDVHPSDWTLRSYGPSVLPVDLYGVHSSAGDAGLIDASQCCCTRTSPALQGLYTLSFNHNKLPTCGGGGAIVNLSEAEERLVRTLLSQGVVADHRPILGFNGRMTGLHAAVGLAQLERLDDMLAVKRHLHSLYTEMLSGVMILQTSIPPSVSSWWMTAGTTRVPGAIMQYELSKVGIPSRRVFPPIHLLLSLPVSCPESEHIYHYGICLPSSVLNSDGAIERVCKEVHRIVTEYKL